MFDSGVWCDLVSVLCACRGSIHRVDSDSPDWLQQRLSAYHSVVQNDVNLVPEPVIFSVRSLCSDLKYDRLQESATSTMDVMASWIESFSPEDHALSI